MAATKWVKCPICENEWTKLRPCLFFWKSEKCQRDVCVRCAETVKSLPHIARQYPIVGTEINLKWSGPKETPVKFVVVKYCATDQDPNPPTVTRVDRFGHPHHQYAVVKHDDVIYVISSKNTAPYLDFSKSGRTGVRHADNIFMAWSMIAYDIEDQERQLPQALKNPRANLKGDFFKDEDNDFLDKN